MPDVVAVNEGLQLVVDESKSSDKPLEIDDVGLVEYFITVQPDREDDFFHDPTPGMKHLFDPNKPSLHTHLVALSHFFDPEERKKATHWLEWMRYGSSNTAPTSSPYRSPGRWRGSCGGTGVVRSSPRLSISGNSQTCWMISRACITDRPRRSVGTIRRCPGLEKETRRAGGGGEL